MAKVLWGSALLLTAQLALMASQGSGHCGPPKLYADKRLVEKFMQQSHFKDGDRVAYQCVVGYRQSEGSRVSFCKNGQWEPLSMACTKKLCGSAGEIENGHFEQEGNLFGDRAHAKCKEGYVLQGESVRVCGNNGWNGTIPTCVDSRSSPPFSTSSTPYAGSSPPLTHSPYPAPSSTEVKAPTCQRPRNAAFHDTKTEYKPGESVSILCNTGSKISNIKCEPTGHWTLPRCNRHEVIKCPELKIPHAKKHTRHVRFNTSITITCERGFQLKGADRITCAANGSWTPAVPTCGSRMSCDRLQHYPNAMPSEEYLSRQQFESGDVVLFRCNYGYRWAGGSPRIRCENGHWTSLELKCVQKQCGSAGEIQNGRFEYTGLSVGDTATAVCNEGYQLFGIGVRRCRPEGWDGRLPVCEIVQCTSPPEVPGAEMSEPTDGPLKYHHVVSYRCLSGTLIGPRDIYCTENGTWNAPPPQCKDVSCPIPTVMFGSKIRFRGRYNPGYFVTFTCNPGRRIEGSRSVTCGKNGNWIPELPECVPIGVPQRNWAK